MKYLVLLLAITLVGCSTRLFDPYRWKASEDMCYKIGTRELVPDVYCGK